MVSVEQLGWHIFVSTVISVFEFYLTVINSVCNYLVWRAFVHSQSSAVIIYASLRYFPVEEISWFSSVLDFIIWWGEVYSLWASFSWLCVQRWASQTISFLINKPTFACYLCWLPMASTYRWQVWACHAGLCGLKTVRHHFLFYMISQVFSQIIFVDWKIKYFTKWDLFIKSGLER